MKNGIIRRNFVIPADDFTAAGEASSSVKKMLIQLGVDPQKVKKTAISMYEAEINAVIHANGGSASVEIDRNRVFIKIQDKGPGIPDLNWL